MDKLTPQEGNQIERCPNCKVVMKLHGTACGWQNAGIIINPFTYEAKQWMKERDEAIGMLPNNPPCKVYEITYENPSGFASKFPKFIEVKC